MSCLSLEPQCSPLSLSPASSLLYLLMAQSSEPFLSLQPDMPMMKLIIYSVWSTMILFGLPLTSQFCCTSFPSFPHSSPVYGVFCYYSCILYFFSLPFIDRGAGSAEDCGRILHAQGLSRCRYVMYLTFPPLNIVLTGLSARFFISVYLCIMR